jgi:phosphopantothenoylcysteine synthetase/decarboxylase
MKTTIVLGVTGSIAAYKAAEICSELTRRGCDVNVIMTEAATRLVTKQTFLTLSRNPVLTNLWDSADWRPEHVALADRASVLLVAPCTANSIGKMANGVADDALSTYYLSHTGKVIIAPAMNPKMWKHPTVAANVEKLKSAGVEIIGPASGRVACGDDGEGRMVSTQAIIKSLEPHLRR